MLRYGLGTLRAKHCSIRLCQGRSYSRGSLTADELEEAREWLASFSEVPSKYYQVSYSRSSGPGGQNVNKYVDLLRLHK